MSDETTCYVCWLDGHVDEDDDWRFYAETPEGAAEKFAVELATHESWWRLAGERMAVRVREHGSTLVREIPLEYEIKIISRVTPQ